MELNRDQIIKALECLNDKHDRICDICPVLKLTNRGYSSCRHIILDEAVAFIKELTEENERLIAENEALAISEVKECEISQMLVYRIRNKHPAVMAVISDTVKKMQECIAEHATNGYPRKVRLDVVDKIAKEMLGE